MKSIFLSLGLKSLDVNESGQVTVSNKPDPSPASTLNAPDSVEPIHLILALQMIPMLNNHIMGFVSIVNAEMNYNVLSNSSK